MPKRPQRWAVVLAGGRGKRLQSIARSAYGDGRPKQFCAVGAARTLIEQTLTRTRLFAPPAQTVVSVCAEHLRWRRLWESGRAKPVLSVQPDPTGTGVAAILAALEIERRNPGAVVAVFPADHFVSDDVRFVAHVGLAAAWVERHPAEMVLLGVVAEAAEVEYGWLQPQPGAPETDHPPRRVRLLEKPSLEEARRLFRGGAAWNTLVTVFHSTAFLARARDTAPGWWPDPGGGQSAAEAGGDVAQELDLSRDLLAHWSDCTRAVLVRGVGWADLGTERRIRDTFPEGLRAVGPREP